jgi:hypothetical protein
LLLLGALVRDVEDICFLLVLNLSTSCLLWYPDDSVDPDLALLGALPLPLLLPLIIKLCLITSLLLLSLYLAFLFMLSSFFTEFCTKLVVFLFGIVKFLNLSKGRILFLWFNSVLLIRFFESSYEASMPSDAESGLEFPGAAGSFLLEREDASG